MLRSMLINLTTKINLRNSSGSTKHRNFSRPLAQPTPFFAKSISKYPLPHSTILSLQKNLFRSFNTQSFNLKGTPDDKIKDQFIKLHDIKDFPIQSNYYPTRHNWREKMPNLNDALNADDVNLVKRYLHHETTTPSPRVIHDALYFACKNGKFNVAKYLIETEKADPNQRFNSVGLDDGPMLKFAAESGNFELVRYLVEDCHVKSIEATGGLAGTQDTALSRAAEKGHLEITQYLIKRDANVNAPISYGSVLRDGISSGRIEIVDALVSAGAKIMPEHVYETIARGNLSILKYLLERGGNIQDRYLDPFTVVAASSGNVELLKYLESLGLQILAKEPFSPWKDPEEEMLKAAAASGSVEMMRYLVETHHLDLKRMVTNENSKPYAYEYSAYDTILGRAINGSAFSKSQTFKLPLLQYLFEELNLIPDQKGLQHLKKEARYSDLKINAYLKSFLVNKVEDKKLLSNISQHGLTPLSVFQLFYLYHSGLLESDTSSDNTHQQIKDLNLSNHQLIELASTNPSFACDAAFYYAEYCFKKDFSTLKFLLENGVSINITNSKGENLICHAARSGGYNPIVRFLIEQGADVDQADLEGHTALSLLGRFDDNGFLDAIKACKKFPTNSLKKACSDFGHSLRAILNYTEGNIGDEITPKELLEASIDSRNTETLLSAVRSNPPVFLAMITLLKDPKFREKHHLSNQNVDDLLVKLAKNEISQSERDAHLVSLLFRSLEKVCEVVEKDYKENHSFPFTVTKNSKSQVSNQGLFGGTTAKNETEEKPISRVGFGGPTK